MKKYVLLTAITLILAAPVAGFAQDQGSAAPSSTTGAASTTTTTTTTSGSGQQAPASGSGQ